MITPFTAIVAAQALGRRSHPERRAQQHQSADRPDASEQEADGRRVGVRDELDIGAEQALRIVADVREPVEPRAAREPEQRRFVREDQPAEPDHHHPQNARRGQRSIEPSP